MAENVHGHVILEHIIAEGGTVPLSALRAFALNNNGSDATYFTCSASGMSFDGLIEFLSKRNKVSVQGELVRVFEENLCGHGEHSHD